MTNVKFSKENELEVKFKIINSNSMEIIVQGDIERIVNVLFLVQLLDEYTTAVSFNSLFFT